MSRIALDADLQLILTGPSGVGKSSVAEYLLHAHGLGTYSLDARCFELYLRDDFFRETAARLQHGGEQSSLEDVLREIARTYKGDLLAYQEAIHLMAVREAVADTCAPVLDLGSGHGSFELAANQADLARLLDPHPFLCLWPSRDEDRACEILVARNRRNPATTRDCLRRHRGREIAKHIIYVEQRGISDIAEEVLAWVRACQGEGIDDRSRYPRAAAATAAGKRSRTHHRAGGA